MASGYQKNKARQDELSRLGKPLSRRAKSRCELCDSAGLKLTPFEVPPMGETPVLDRTVLICHVCTTSLESGPVDAAHARCLTNTMWSEVPAIQVCAVRILRQLAETGAHWASESLESLYLSPEVEAWVNASQLKR
ncbi:MAG: phnA protein [Myxococcota bacterium]|nr:phnA protein [Myxococcota bacterium]